MEPVPIERARALVEAALEPLPAELVPLEEALGRFLAEDVLSDRDVPPFDSSAMDGFAVPPGADGELTIVGESRAGRPAAERLAAGEAMRIATGAVIPAGAGAVVEVESAESTDGRVRVPPVAPGRNVRRAGEDVRRGERVLAQGARVGPAELAALASVGHAHVRCGTRPRVALVVTGDELVEPGADLQPGQIVDSNRIALAAQASRAGAAMVHASRAGDTREATVAALATALDEADLVCVSGGVSVGEYDHVRPALAELGAGQRFWGVQLKPGKPLWFGTRGRTAAFALPGNPVSAMVCFELFVRPALVRLAGGHFTPRRLAAVLDRPLARPRGRTEAVRCRLSWRPDGPHAEPTGPQGSHLIGSLVGADALALIEPGDGDLAAGERVTVELLAGS